MRNGAAPIPKQSMYGKIDRILTTKLDQHINQNSQDNVIVNPKKKEIIDSSIRE